MSKSGRYIQKIADIFLTAYMDNDRIEEKIIGNLGGTGFAK